LYNSEFICQVSRGRTVKVRRGGFNADKLRVKIQLCKKKKKVSNRYLAALCSTFWLGYLFY